MNLHSQKADRANCVFLWNHSACHVLCGFAFQMMYTNLAIIFTSLLEVSPPPPPVINYEYVIGFEVQAILYRTSFGTASNATVQKLLREGIEPICAFSSV